MVVPKKTVSNINCTTTLEEQDIQLGKTETNVTEVKECERGKNQSFEDQSVPCVANIGNTTGINVDEFTEAASDEKSDGDSDAPTFRHVTDIDLPGEGVNRSEDVKASTGHAERSPTELLIGNTKNADNQDLIPDCKNHSYNQHLPENIEKVNNDQTAVQSADFVLEQKGSTNHTHRNREFLISSNNVIYLTCLMIPKRPYMLTKVFFKQFSLLCPNGPYLSTHLICKHISLLCPNSPFFLAQVICMEVSLLYLNGPYLLAQVICMEVSLLCPYGQFWFAKVVCMQVYRAPRVTWMKSVFHVHVVKDLDLIGSDCFSKFDKQKCIDKILDLSFKPCNQIYAPVYAIAVDYNHDDRTTHGTDRLVISDHQVPPLIYNPGQQRGLVADIQEGPIQQPQQNGTAVLVVSHHEPIAHHYQQQPNYAWGLLVIFMAMLYIYIYIN